MIVFDPARHPIQLDTPIHEGGEGWISRILGQPGKVAKIYKPLRQAGRETKLRWMVANPPNDPGRSIGHTSIAWPEFLLYDARGSFVGYVMPEITNACKMLNVLSPHLRAKTFASFDDHRLYRVAYNLATAVGALHACDYTIGDLNESNILVTPEALVTVIDTDSFQVREQREGQIIFYPCPVGRPEFTPPELQGKAFQGEVRQPEQDAFALAVLIFQLLMHGSHPFRAIWLGPGEPPSVEERIYLGLFPYANPPAAGLVSPPPNLALDRLSPPLSDLMLRCFVDGQTNPKNRPLPLEWKRLLKDGENSLVTCPNKHVYPGHLAQCPQCGLPTPLHLVTKFKAPRIPPVPRPAAHPPPPAAPAPANLPPAAPVTCIRCNASVPAADLYCPQCANPVDPVTCRHCGFKDMPRMARCCPMCGKYP
jgi:DNA-binding helix-hairpin-helix protein with protein kinase domain